MRPTRLVLGGLITTATVLFLGSSARAGGGHWTFEGHAGETEAVLEAGDQVHATIDLWLKGVGPREEEGAFWGGPEHGPFFAYVAPRGGTGWGPYPPPLPGNAIPVGNVVFAETDDPQVMNATLDFVMPELKPGYYSVLHCNDPCTRQIGDTMSTPITVVEDRGQAFIAARVDRVDQGLSSLRERVRDRVGGLRAFNRRLELHIASLEDKIGSLERAAEAARRSSSPSPSTNPWGLWAALAVIALLLAVSWMGWRRTNPVPRFDAE